MNKENPPEPWEIVRDKLLGVEIYGSNLTPDIINNYLYKHLQETGEVKEKVYVSKAGFENLINYYGSKVHPLSSFNTIKIYSAIGISEIIPL